MITASVSLLLLVLAAPLHTGSLQWDVVVGAANRGRVVDIDDVSILPRRCFFALPSCSCSLSFFGESALKLVHVRPGLLLDFCRWLDDRHDHLGVSPFIMVNYNTISNFLHTTYTYNCSWMELKMKRALIVQFSHFAVAFYDQSVVDLRVHKCPNVGVFSFCNVTLGKSGYRPKISPTAMSKNLSS